MDTNQTRRQLGWVFAVQSLLLVIAAWRNLHQLNPDAIAYLRIAGYYAGGQVELAVTGYWGPLLSWLMVPLLKAGVAPLVSARVVMAVSGVVFLAGAVAVFRAFRLPRVALLTGAWMAVGWSVFWSVRHITPDLLMAGLAGLAMAVTLEAVLAPNDTLNAEVQRARRAAEAEGKPDGPEGSSNLRALCASALKGPFPANRVWRLTIAAGMWWGLAYLAKAVALPWAVLVTAGFALFAARGRPELRRELAARLGLMWLCLALVAGPWMAVLSMHYRKFTFSTTGPIAHALAGPGEVSRYHPAMVTLHHPDAGRVTQWEEPSRMAYRHWSPFASGENFRHQLAVAWGSAGICWNWVSPWKAWLNGAELPTWRRWLGAFDLLGIGGLAVLCAGACVVRNRSRLRRGRWCWAAVPVVALGGLYLPFFVMAEDNRYFYPVWPCLWLTARAGLAALPRGEARWLGWRIIAASFAIPSVLLCGAALHGLPNPAAEAAHKLAAQLRADTLAGPFAGSASLPGGRTGLYTASLLGGRWLGDDPQAGPEAFSKVGAQVVFVRRGSPAFASFASDRGWREWTTAAERSSAIGELMTGRLFLPEPSDSAIRLFVRKSP